MTKKEFDFTRPSGAIDALYDVSTPQGRENVADVIGKLVSIIMDDAVDWAYGTNIEVIPVNKNLFFEADDIELLRYSKAWSCLDKLSNITKMGSSGMMDFVDVVLEYFDARKRTLRPSGKNLKLGSIS